MNLSALSAGEGTAAVLLAAVLLAVLLQEKRQACAGQRAWSWLILEASRTDSLYLAGVRQAQVGALLLLLASLAGLHLMARADKPGGPFGTPEEERAAVTPSAP